MYRSEVIRRLKCVTMDAIIDLTFSLILREKCGSVYMVFMDIFLCVTNGPFGNTQFFLRVVRFYTLVLLSFLCD